MKALPPVYAVVKNSGVEIPIIDMSAPKDDIIEQMWDAAQNVGFFNMINHGIPQDDILTISLHCVQGVLCTIS